MRRQLHWPRVGVVSAVALLLGFWSAASVLAARDSASGTDVSAAKRGNAPPGSCAPSATTLCIDDQSGDGRFEVKVHYQTAQGGGLSGEGHTIDLAGLGVTHGGLFWFFGADNPEMLIKVINACGLNQNYWVFYSAGTNVGLTVTVIDTQTGGSVVYRNPDLTAAPPLQDTAALPCSSGKAGRMAFVSRQSSVNRIYLMDVDASGVGSNPTTLTNDGESESYPFWSPDGKRLVYQRAFNGTGIYVINADGTGQRRLSPTPGFDVSPFWSPDGAKIVYARLLAAPQPNQPPPMTDIRVMNADGTGDHAILANTVFSVEPQWSVNGQVVFMSYMSGGKLDIYVINVDGTGLRQLTSAAGNNGDPVWSPDGTRITFGSDREGGNKLNIFTMNADGSQPQQLTHFDVPYEAGNPNWSGDGKKIAFQYDINGMKQSDPNAHAEVWTMNPDGSGATSTGVQCSNVGCDPTWQPRAVASNAQIVLMSGSVPGPGAPVINELVTMNLDGSNRRQITSDGKNKFLPHFSPDGTQLLYTKFRTGAYGQPGSLTDLAVYDFASAKETLLTSTGQAYQPAWSPDGKRIVWLSTSSPLTALEVMNADGSSVQTIASASSAPDNLILGDPAWSSDNWILFVVGQNNSNGTCFKARLDKIRPDGSARTQVTDGGPNCSPNGKEPSGDADPGFSSDGKTIYTSRGFPVAPAGGPPNATERKLYAVSSDPWYPGKPETDLSLPSEPSCIEGVPKGSPDGTLVLLFRACFGASPASGIFVTDTAGSYRTKIADGFGPDWNPAAAGPDQ
jgi:Tol biopolymer transport system component